MTSSSSASRDPLRQLGAEVFRLPHDVQARMAFGRALIEAGRFDEGVRELAQAIRLAPADPRPHFYIGIALADAGRFAEALEHFEHVLALKPDHVATLNAAGVALIRLDRAQDALVRFDAAKAIDPAHADTLSNRGACLVQLGRHEEAIADLRGALRGDARQPEAWNNLGASLARLGRHLGAVEAFREALALQPDEPEALANLGQSLAALGRDAEALDALRASLRHAYRHDVCVRCIRHLTEMRRLDGALAVADLALTREPGDPELRRVRAAVLAQVGRATEAVDELRAVAAEDDPDYLAQLARALVEAKMDEDAIPAMRRALFANPDDLGLAADAVLLFRRTQTRDGLAELEASLIDRTARAAADPGGSSRVPPFAFCAIGRDPALQLANARVEARSWLDRVPEEQIRPRRAVERAAGDRIRIGYVSPDFRTHPVGMNMLPVFERHDRDRFDVTALSLVPSSDAWRARIVAAFPRFVDLEAMNDEAAARLVEELEIDVLVDLAGYTAHCRPGIFARRPAPVQVNCHGMTSTAGAPWLDYIVVDGVVVPPGDQASYEEKAVWLPDSYFPPGLGAAIAIPPAPRRAELGLPDGAVVFCSFNNAYKLTPADADLWLAILGRVPGSVLWILLGPEPARERLRQEARRAGIDPSRLAFADTRPVEQHVARLAAADLFLDSLPFNAQTTAAESIWAGLPVLTRAGSTFAGRVAASIVTAAGLPELVTTTDADYVETAVRLAAAPGALAALKTKLGTARSQAPFFDAARYTRNLEKAYREMVRISREGQPPRPITVARLPD